jgi:hypothetical protein
MQDALQRAHHASRSGNPGVAQRPAARILATLAFFCVAAPLALLERLRGRDRLGLRLERQRTSYWLVRPRERSSQHVYDPY